MTTSDSADRITLFHLMQLHPDWSQEQLAQAIGRSKRWVSKWQTRLENVSAGDDAAHKCGSRCPDTPQTGPKLPENHCLRDCPPNADRDPK